MAVLILLSAAATIPAGEPSAKPPPPEGVEAGDAPWDGGNKIRLRWDLPSQQDAEAQGIWR